MRKPLIAAVRTAAFLPASALASAQAPAGPLPPKPGAPVQQAPTDKDQRIRVRVELVTTPVTVRDAAGEMVLDLERKDFLRVRRRRRAAHRGLRPGRRPPELGHRDGEQFAHPTRAT